MENQTETIIDSGSDLGLTKGWRHLFNLFVEPSKALAYAQRRPASFIWPLSLQVTAVLALGAYYAHAVNLAWLRQTYINLIIQKNPAAAGYAANAAPASATRVFLLFGIGAALGLVIVYLVFALYLFLADKLLSADSQGYSRWFSFTTWTWLPAILGTILAGIVFALSNHRMLLQKADMTNLNNLLFHFHSGSHAAALANFSFLYFWILGLLIFGMKYWRQYSSSKALAVAIIPFIAVYAIRFALA